MAFINSLISLFTSKRLSQIDYFKTNPSEVQRNVLKELLTTAAKTEYGQKHHFIPFPQQNNTGNAFPSSTTKTYGN